MGNGRFPLLASLGAALLAGCSVGPSYVRPELPSPAAWTATEGAPTSTDSKDLAHWWKTFQDPLLNELLERAARSAPDLRLAQSRVRQARALRAVAAGAELPTASAGGTATRKRTSETTPGVPPGLPPVTELFQAGFDAAWELDVFGGVRRTVEAADAEVQASVEDLRSTLVSLFGEVARNYVEVRAFQRRLAVASESLAAQRETRSVTNSRFEAGLAPGFDVDRATAQAASVEAQIPLLDASLRRAVHRIAVLVGEQPQALAALLEPVAPIPSPPPELQVGLPSDLLERRPDLRRAERLLAAATARVGAAEAELYPRFSLAGSFGFQSGSLGDLSLATSRFWSVGPSVRLPLFQGGRLRANVGVRNEEQTQALIAYERAFLSAQEEVENALLAFGKEEARRRALRQAVEADEQALQTARSLYSSGIADFLHVLDAQRSLLSARAQLADSEAGSAAQLVALYKALGGGWQLLDSEGARQAEGHAGASPPGKAAR